MRLGDQAAHTMRRLASFIMGVLTQLAVGILAWTFPPGTSALSWVLYIGLGVLGFIQIIWGARGWKHAPQTEDRDAITASFEPDDIPYHAKVCPAPGCGQNIAATIAKGARRCPKCQRHFSLRELGWRQFDPHGEPVSYAPHEARLRGPVLVGLILAIFGSIVLAYWGFGVLSPSKPAAPAKAPGVTP